MITRKIYSIAALALSLAVPATSALAQTYTPLAGIPINDFLKSNDGITTSHDNRTSKSIQDHRKASHDQEMQSRYHRAVESSATSSIAD